MDAIKAKLGCCGYGIRLHRRCGGLPKHESGVRQKAKQFFNDRGARST